MFPAGVFVVVVALSAFLASHLACASEEERAKSTERGE